MLESDTAHDALTLDDSLGWRLFDTGSGGRR